MTHRLLRFSAWLALAALLFVTVAPIEWRPHTLTSVGLDRAGAFALAGAVFAIAYPRRWFSLALFLVAAAYGLEAMQLLSPTRHAHVEDATIKAFGSIVGVTLGKMALTLHRHRIRREPSSATARFGAPRP